jgi:lambda family phage portal protein
MRQAKLIDGESFAAMITNPKLDGVQLDLRMIEAEQVSTPLATVKEKTSYEGSLVDGLEFDAVGNVTSYTVLRYHPGSNYHVSEIDYAKIPAEQMFHWFTQIRPAQNRGLSEVAPCLRLFADLRRYTGAVIAAAETAADFAAFIHSNSPAAEVDEVEAFAAMEIEQRSLVTLPEGWNVSQLRAEQPTATFADFRRNIISEIGRSLQIPYAIAALDSSSHNYASARMDAQLYTTNIRVQRDEIERTILDRLFVAWLQEANLVGDISRQMGDAESLDWSWQWDGKDHVDPIKEAKATETRLATNTTTLAAEYARQGKSWEQELNQRAVELKKMQELGLINEAEAEAEEAEQQEQEKPVEANAIPKFAYKKKRATKKAKK